MSDTTTNAIANEAVPGQHSIENLRTAVIGFANAATDPKLLIDALHLFAYGSAKPAPAPTPTPAQTFASPEPAEPKRKKRRANDPTGLHARIRKILELPEIVRTGMTVEEITETLRKNRLLRNGEDIKDVRFRLQKNRQVFAEVGDRWMLRKHYGLEPVLAA